MDIGINMLPNLLPLLVIWVFLVPLILMWLWNMTMPDLFGLKTLRYWQAFRLILISMILTGGLFGFR